jgi:hypothetical protein
MRIAVHRPKPPRELELYTHYWETMPELGWWDKFWSGIQ